MHTHLFMLLYYYKNLVNLCLTTKALNALVVKVTAEVACYSLHVYCSGAMVFYLPKKPGHLSSWYNHTFIIYFVLSYHNVVYLCGVCLSGCVVLTKSQ